jgi:ferredoxin-NADP reductase
MEFETTVADIIQRTPEVKSFRFKRPESFYYDPGQFIFVTILINGQKAIKHFSISSSPTEKEYLEFTKKITDHEFSVGLDHLHPGDWAYLNGPLGEFTFRGEYPKIAMITGGIGITPIRSIIKFCTDTAIPSDITLLYGNRNEQSIVFKEELDDLEKMNHNLKVVHCLSRPTDAWKGKQGHVDVRLIQDEIPDYNERVFYVCGPPALVTDLEKDIRSLNIPDNRIKLETFPGY